ncbi:hypothetical protein LG201_04155 [Methylobacillus gramineus]|uniref:hypothetical protein n=1 Tax=Methylobacillus gramineus TaxID=755169 RepID=UPI001CFFED6D|nr:hypothetical protein [Methylobacillus gramineus]MCB5184393.1 hypothetical protein [Methylobacillus gramineus]
MAGTMPVGGVVCMYLISKVVYIFIVVGMGFYAEKQTVLPVDIATSVVFSSLNCWVGQFF